MTSLISPNQAAWNKYSQFGEDGVIDNLLSRLPTQDNWCVEFGAWDGLYLTNTRRLIEDIAYSAVLIEGDKSRFHALQKTYAGSDKVHPVHRFVRSSGKDSLDSILSLTNIPQEFDLLSIDIDGNDYHIWESVRHYKPKIVVIEFNPTMSNEMDYVQPNRSSVMHGSSASALVRLGREKGYSVVAVTLCNAFFVRDELLDSMGLVRANLSDLRTNQDMVTHIAFGYDGNVLVSGSSKLPWHRLQISPERFQVLPMWLRSFPDNYNHGQRIAYRLFKALNQPQDTLSQLKVRLSRRIARK